MRVKHPPRPRHLRSIAFAATFVIIGVGVVLVDGQAAKPPIIQAQGAERPSGDAMDGGNGATKAPPPPDPAMPVGDLPGWKQVFSDDFSSGNVPIGGFPGPGYQEKWSSNYPDGTPDTAGQQNSGKSGYYPSKVLSVKDGYLDFYVHSENGVSMGAAPSPKIPGANPGRANSLLYGRYSVRFKADAGLKGFKLAWLLWPDSGVWPRDGEIDYPEGDLAASFYGAAHPMGPDISKSHVFWSGATFTSWHIATMEWSPGRVEYILDGRSIGISTNDIPTTPMHYILQTESCLTGCPAPTTAGHVYLDWIAIWAKE